MSEEIEVGRVRNMYDHEIQRMIAIVEYDIGSCDLVKVGWPRANEAQRMEHRPTCKKCFVVGRLRTIAEELKNTSSLCEDL